MSSRRKTALATVQRSEDPILRSVRFNNEGEYTEYGSDEDGIEMPELTKPASQSDLGSASPPLPMSPLTEPEESSSDSNEGEEEEETPAVRNNGDDGHGQPPDLSRSQSPTYYEDQEDGEGEMDESGLPRTPFTRNYICAQCDFHTQNPRTHLYHQRDVHGAKGKIYECLQCVYASNHSQKVSRHMEKCHNPMIQMQQQLWQQQQLEHISQPKPQPKPQPKLPPPLKAKPEPFLFLKNLLLKEKQEKAAAANARRNLEQDNEEEETEGDFQEQSHGGGESTLSNQEDGSSSDGDGSSSSSSGSSDEDAEPSITENQNEQEQNPDGEEDQEQQEVNTEEEQPGPSPGSGNEQENDTDELPLRCKLCNYSTRNRSRYAKHVRYHSMPLIKCTYCDFKTPYKWNLDRHYKSHNGEGTLKCPLCNFSAEIKQSITVHIQNHHENLTAVRVLELVQSLDTSKQSHVGDEAIPPLPRLYAATGHKTSGMASASEKLSRLAASATAVRPSTSASAIRRFNPAVDTNGKVSQKKFACNYCGFKAGWESELNRHLRRTHGIAARSPPTFTPVSTVSATSRSKTGTKVPDKKKADTLQAALCPNVVYSFGDEAEAEAGEEEDLDNLDESQMNFGGVIGCEYCSDIFSTEDELLFHQSTCAGLAKIQEWNGGLLWNGEGDEVEQGASQPVQRPRFSVFSQQGGSGVAKTTQRKVYKCPEAGCTFWAVTASRFHVHMVGHSNSKPFECSLCFYKSNWRWDIAKHIKLKMQRDPEHALAKVLLTHESGERNYKEYDQYLTLMKVKHSGELKLPDCSTKADKRDDIQTEISEGKETDEVEKAAASASPSETPMPKLVKAVSSSGTLQTEKPHNFIKPNASPVPRKVTNFLRDGRPTTPNSSKSNITQKESSPSPPKLFKADATKPNPVIWKCKKCAFRHLSKDEVMTHLRQYHDIRPSTSILKTNSPPVLKPESPLMAFKKEVNWNDATVPTVSKAETHQYSFNEDGGFTCKFCPFTTMKLDLIISHSENHFSKPNCTFSCDYCSFSVASQALLDEHTVLHAGEIEDADHIPVPQVQRRILKQPSRTPAASKRKFTCEECPYFTDSRGQFHYHCQFHKIRASLYKCSHCTYNVSHKHLLHQHLRVHQGEASVVAAVSSQNNNSSRVTRPEIIVCELCPQRFFHVRQLQHHSIFHERQWPLQCSECSYSVRNQDHLNAHGISHTVEYQRTTDILIGPTTTKVRTEPVRPAPRPVRRAPPLLVRPPAVRQTPKFQEPGDEACEGNPEFQYPTHVKNGKLKEKRYKCKKCPSAFEKRDQYTVHIGLHGSKQRYQCTVCDYAVTFYANFIQHLKKHRLQPGVPQELLESVPLCKRKPAGTAQSSKSAPPPSKKKVASFQCDHCNYETRQQNLLDDHVHVMHPEQGMQGHMEVDEESEESESESNSNGGQVEGEIYEEEEGVEAGNNNDNEDNEEEIVYDQDQEEDHEQEYQDGTEEVEDGYPEGEEEEEEPEVEDEEADLVED